MSETVETIEQISTDFSEGNGPFADVQFPEERLMTELPAGSMEDRAILASMFSTFDYNRDANQLVDNIIELHSRDSTLFDALSVSSKKELEHHFDDIGFRYPNRDANAWATNCKILCEKYNGKWSELLLDVSADAPTLVERLNDDGFHCLKGVKIAPMYARIIDDEVAPLSNVWDLELPVDVHTRRLSHDLFENWVNVTSDDDIRAVWRDLADEHGIERHVVDGALWHIGNKWESWGKEYWNRVTA